MSDESKGDLLIVDDTLPNLRLLSKLLVDNGYKVRGVQNGKMAIRAVEASPPELILLDIMMPDTTGYEVCEHLKASDARDIPIIFISALDDTQDKIRSCQVGGADYVSKPFQAEEVLARVGTHLALRRLQVQLNEVDDHVEARVEKRTNELAKTVSELQSQLQQLVDDRKEA